VVRPVTLRTVTPKAPERPATVIAPNLPPSPTAAPSSSKTMRNTTVILAGTTLSEST
jgi:hypothetical protein